MSLIVVVGGDRVTVSGLAAAIVGALVRHQAELNAQAKRAGVVEVHFGSGHLSVKLSTVLQRERIAD